MALFDRYLIVDWSGASKPRLGRDSLWACLASLDGDDPRIEWIENFPTRHAFMERLDAIVAATLAAGERLLCGFDFAFGYPVGAAERMTGMADWRAIWRKIAAGIEDGIDNRNNRFEQAGRWNDAYFPGEPRFWGRPHQHRYDGLTDTRPPAPSGAPFSFRISEKHAKGAKSVWQLSYNGSVGSQALLGIRHLAHFIERPEFAGKVVVWPFETGFTSDPVTPVVLAEIYPSLFKVSVGKEQVKDQAQVLAVAEAFARFDAAGVLGRLFERPAGLDDAEIGILLREEGWVLGIGHERLREAAGALVFVPPSKPWLTVVGIGDDGAAGLSVEKRAVIEASEQIVFGERLEGLLDEVEVPGLRRILNWSAGFRATMNEILKLRGTPVTVIATGDPMHFGIGATLQRYLEPGEMRVMPAPSAFSLAAARLGWPLQAVAQISLHGRPVAHFARHLLPGMRILALTSDRNTVRDAAALMTEQGFGASILTVLEHIGGADERISSLTAAEFLARDPHIGDFHVLAIDCVSSGRFHPPVPGLPDEAFRHDGHLTRREVRAATLALLAPYPNALLWDVGAGCGSVTVEWLRTGMGTRAIAIETDATRIVMMQDNAMALGVPDLEIVSGEAPDALAGLPQPDAIFIGGGLTRHGLFDTCWRALTPGGRLVANAVTIDAEAELARLRARYGGELTRIAVARAGPGDRNCGWKSLMPVTIWSVTRESGG